MAKNASKKTRDLLPAVTLLFNRIMQKAVYVGVPADKTGRNDDSGLTNAEIAYIQDNGAPEAGIPARPFMQPGIKKALPAITENLKKAAQVGLTGGNSDTYLGRAGMAAQNSIKHEITEGIPPPLKPSTIANRYRQRGAKSRRKGEKAYMQMIGAGASNADAQSAAGIVPLVNTAQLLNSITYVIRDKNK